MTAGILETTAAGSSPTRGASQLKALQTYDAAADCFDAPPLGFWARHGAATVAQLGLAEGATVLDVACGSGASAIPAAEAVGPRGEVVGLDLSDAMLALARRKAVARRLGNVAFHRADMTESGFPDRSFDAVVCVFGIFFANDMAGLVSELWRMVRLGGQLAVTTWGSDLFAPASDLWWRAVAGERADLVTAYNPWDEIVTADGLCRLLEKGGVPTPTVTIREDSQPLAVPEDWWTIVMGSGLRWTVDAMGPAAAARVRETNLRLIAETGVTSVKTSAIIARATKSPATTS